MIFDVWFFNFDPLLIPNATSQHTVLQLYFNCTDLPRIKHPLIWSDLLLHMIGIGGDITD